MKKLLKIGVVAAVVLSLATVGLVTARAAGWPVAAGRVRGFAAVPILGRAVVPYPAAVARCSYPQTVYLAPFCSPAPLVLQVPPVYCVPPPVVYPVFCPPVRHPVIAARPHYFRR